jgi:hypothetical protein
MASTILTDDQRKSYVYVIFRLNGIPCYVGQGSGNRYKRHGFNKNSRNKHLAEIYKNSEKPLPVAIIREGLSRDEAIEIEAAFIRAIGRELHGGPLVNQSDGGEGPMGWKASEEWRKHRSEEAKKLWQDPEYRAMMLREDRGRSGNKTRRSDEFKTAMSERLKGNTHTLGFTHSDDAKEKMSIARKGKAKTQEWKDKIGLAHRLLAQRNNLEYDMP